MVFHKDIWYNKFVDHNYSTWLKQNIFVCFERADERDEEAGKWWYFSVEERIQ